MKRVVIFGTFDIFHPGHESFLKQAKKLGEYLLVVVARNRSVQKVKGQTPKNDEKVRARNVSRENLANKVILGSKTHNYFQTLRTYQIDTIALGYDQKPKIVDLKKALKRHQLSQVTVVRLKPYNPGKFKSSLLKENVW
ncbi:MAG TPA: adenylyltransferase/cytidyltransferase family protein [Candidatus Nanoarchaeia archaeon]|nr:bifunctional protein HldE [uncultured archaeon]